MRRFNPVVLTCAIAVLLSTAGAAFAAPNTIAEIRVEGVKQMSPEAVLSNCKMRVGQQYDDAVVQADHKMLLETGRFQSVVITQTPTDAGMIITIKVVERPRIAKVVFEGNTTIKTADLVKLVGLSAGDAVDVALARKGAEALQEKYRQTGHPNAVVSLDEKAIQASGDLIYHIREGGVTFVRKVKFEGNKFFTSLWLRQRVEISRRFWPFLPGELDMEKVDRDVNTVKDMYEEEGFLGVSVDRVLDFSGNHGSAVVTFVINEGPRFTVDKITFQGNKVFGNEQLAARLSLQSGAIFTPVKLRRDTEAVEDSYGQLGYVDAKATSQRTFTSDPGKVNVEFSVVEGGTYTIGKIDIRNNTVTQERVIRRELTILPGQRFDTVAMKDSQQRLKETQLFEDVKIRPVGDAPDVRDAVVEVKEGRTAQFMFGVGVSTDSGLLGSVSVTERNFDFFRPPQRARDIIDGKAWKGAGQTLRLSAEPGTDVSRYSIDWREPYLFDKPYSLGTQIYYYSREWDDYDEARYGAMVSLGRRFPNLWYAEVAGRIESISIDNLDNDAAPELVRDQGDYLVLPVKASLSRDRTDSRWRPSRGDRFKVSYEQYTNDLDFGRIDGAYSRFFTLYMDSLDRKHILSLRTSAGYIVGDAPVFEEYYGGGSNFRGFELRGISPRSAGTDKAIGGDFSFFAGAEYEFPMIGKDLNGVLFLDSGTVESEAGFGTYRVSAGFGLRWYIPMMGPVPIKLDFGFPLVKDSQDDTQVFSFTIGLMF